MSLPWHLLAEIEEKLLKDEDGPCAAEDDERLSREEAEQGPRHGSAQEALHHTLADRGVTGGKRPASTQGPSSLRVSFSSDSAPHPHYNPNVSI